MSQRNNFKNENNNSEDEMESLNEEDEDNDLFMNKKELVHIENDTSINVDKSFEDDHSKTSTMKKGGLIINNISAIKEQFSQAVDLSDKKIVDQNFFSKQIKAELGDLNDTEDKIEQKGLNNLKKNQNGIRINPTNYFEAFNNVALENNNNNNNNNLQNSSINILNNMIIGKKNYIINDNSSLKANKFSISNFHHSIIGFNDINNHNKSQNEIKNQNNQLETNYFNLNNQYKKLKNDYDELNTSNKSLLELLLYWQKFYLEIKEIVLPEGKKNNNDLSINDYMDDPYRIQVIDEVKKLIIIARDKAHNNLYKASDINFSILKDSKINKKNIINNIEQIRVESFNLNHDIIKPDDVNENMNELKISKKFLDESDDLDFPPIRYYSEKINIGINTDKELSENKKEIIFDSKKLSICKVNINYEIKGNKNNNKLQLDNPIILKKANPKKNKKIEFQILNSENFIIKGKTNFPKKFKKNTTYKFACIQTDVSKDIIDNLFLFKEENEVIQKQLKEKINNFNSMKENSEVKNEKIYKGSNSPSKNANINSKMFLPEMIPPENTYKIFLNCIKNFKYEEGIYQQYIVEDDIIILKKFVEKMEKYLIGTSLPVLKAKKRKDYIIHTKLNNESSLQKKYKERILSGARPNYTNINLKKRNASDSKNYYERSN